LRSIRESFIDDEGKNEDNQRAAAKPFVARFFLRRGGKKLRKK
jgi:hypothetical protein